MLSENRDYIKKNRSNLAVCGCIYGRIGIEAVELLAKSVKRRKLSDATVGVQLRTLATQTRATSAKYDDSVIQEGKRPSKVIHTNSA